MAAVYSTSLFQIQGLSGDRTIAVAAGTVVVVRDIQVYYDFGGSPEATFRLLGDVAQTVVFWRFTITSGDPTFLWTGRQVFNDSVTLQTTDAMDCSVSGYILTLP